FSTDIYNELPDLTVTTERLTMLKGPFDRFVLEASAILTRARLGDGELGAFLLHRHWTLGPGQLMVERPRFLESGKPALVTCSVDAAVVRDGVAPCRWIASSS